MSLPTDTPSNDGLEPERLQAARVASVEKGELEREQLRLSNEKLKIETDKLKIDATPEKWWSKTIKNVVAAGGIITVAATAFGLYDSYSKTLAERERIQLAERRTQFEEAIKKLESKSTIAKLVGVSILSGYFSENYRAFHRQILFTLASVVATESDPQTQAAIFDLMSGQDPQAVMPDDWKYFQSMLVSQSRALMAKGHLYRKRQFGIEGIAPSDEEAAARNVGKLIAANVRKGVVPDYGAYRNIYCEACNFRGAKFPIGADFTASVLDRADFRGATLEAASFDNADMGGTVFSEAFLKDAKFRTLSEDHVSDGLIIDPKDESTVKLFTPYFQHIEQLLLSQGQFSIMMPNFSCANLRGAQFDFFALFNIPNQATLRVTPPSFYKADLNGAHLENMRYFLSLGASETNETRGHFTLARNSERGRIREGTIRDEFFSVPPRELDGTRKLPPVESEGFGAYRYEFQFGLRWALHGAIIENAILPPGVADVLETKLPADLNIRRSFQTIYRPNGELIWNCKARTAP
jgi:uncharacterized protein YjbI with pentapeptide repeats